MTFRPWQPPVVVFPDAVALVVVHLRGLPEFGGVFVGADLTAWRRPMPALQVQRVGGRGEGLLDVPRLQVDAFAEDFDGTFDLTADVRSAMAALPLLLPNVARVEEGTVALYLPQEDGPRMVSDFHVAIRPQGKP
jgi:hypothetical protein